ncbi:MAG: T9SS type A sorting domain-containing protein, partial [Ignavibacteriota bacterium]
SFVLAGSSDLVGGDVATNFGHEDFWVVKLSNKPQSGVHFSSGKYPPGTNFPNPFSDRTEINFTESFPVSGELILYDLLGNELRRIMISENIHKITIERGELSSGVYVYRIVSKGLLVLTGNLMVR